MKDISPIKALALAVLLLTAWLLLETFRLDRLKRAVAKLSKTNAPTTQFYSTNLSLVFTDDGEKMIWKPVMEVGWRSDGVLLWRIKETPPHPSDSKSSRP